MDLFFNNRTYFFLTYFDVSGTEIALCFLLLFSALCLLSGLFAGRGGKPFCPAALARCFLLSAALTLVAVTVLLNHARGAGRDFAPNPLPDLAAIFDGNVHAIRHARANIALFIPLGIFSAVPDLNRRRRFALLGFPLSAAFEALQFLFRRGCAESIDVLLNGIGFSVGFLFGSLFLGLLFQPGRRSATKKNTVTTPGRRG